MFILLFPVLVYQSCICSTILGAWSLICEDLAISIDLYIFLLISCQRSFHGSRLSHYVDGVFLPRVIYENVDIMFIEIYRIH
jgi:hypothetical protein